MIKSFFLICFFLTQYCYADSCAHTDIRFNCVKFIKNYDGDTLTVDIPNAPRFFGKNSKVRVLGVDTAEIKTKDACERSMAKRAKEFTKIELTKAKRIDLIDIGQDKYFRILAEVLYDGRKLSQELIKNNLAVAYYGKKKQKINWCEYLK